MPVGPGRAAGFARAEGEFGRLHEFVDESVDRPGVDEFARTLRPVGGLRVALRDLDQADRHPAGEGSPFGGPAGIRRVGCELVPKVEQGLLDEVRHESRVGAMVDDRGRGRRAQALSEPQHALAGHEIGPFAQRQHRVVEDAGPGLDRRIDVQRTVLRAPLDQVEARDVDRQVQDEVALADVAGQLAMVVARLQMAVSEACARRLGDAAPALVGREHRQRIGAGQDVVAQQRQDRLPDAAAPDHHQAIAEFDRLQAVAAIGTPILAYSILPILKQEKPLLSRQPPVLWVRL